MITTHFLVKCLMLGIVLSMFGAGTASAYTVNTTATYEKDEQGRCVHNGNHDPCVIDLFAQAEGAAEPVKYEWYSSEDTTGYTRNTDQRAQFRYEGNGQVNPTVKVTDGNGEVVYASPGPIEIVEYQPPIQFIGQTRGIGSQSVFGVYTERPETLTVQWRSGNTLVKALSASCTFGGPAGMRCYRIAAAPKGNLELIARAGSEVVTEAGRYNGRPAGEWRPSLSVKRVARGCVLSGRLSGAAGVAYRYRGTLTVQYRSKGSKRWRKLRSVTRSRRGTPAYEPIAPIGKVSSLMSYTRKIARLDAAGAAFRFQVTPKVIIGGRNWGPKKSVRRFSPARCRAR